MNQCEPFGVDGPAGISDALSKVDCLANEATAMSFGRLFGAHGSFITALTIIMTLYIALLAFNLLTGRSALRISVLTPRMMTLGLVLTFATSWVAYQSVVWNLATGAPDEIASVLVGSKGSATTLFANQLDGFFAAITDAASKIPATPANAANPAAAAAAMAATPTFASPANILSIGALLLLLGTVGVLVVCRLALAALLILGPIFIILALFEGTRGLFEGWLKSVVLFALVPLLTVVMGSGALVAIAPMVAGLDQAGPNIPLSTAVSILVASIIYLSLMILVFKVAGTLTKSWRLGRASAAAASANQAFVQAQQQAALNPVAAPAVATSSHSLGSDRVRSTVASIEAMSSSARLAAPAMARLAMPSPALVPAASVAGPADARGQLRYLHHRVGGPSSNSDSREMLR